MIPVVTHDIELPEHAYPHVVRLPAAVARCNPEELRGRGGRSVQNEGGELSGGVPER